MGKGPICSHGRRRRDCGLCDGSSVFKRHLRNAATRDIPNDLDEERYRWLISQPCAYCGSEPAGGVDRVKNDWGYTMLNSVPCCSKCNYCKGTMTASDFIAHAANVVAVSATYEQFKTRWVITRTGGPVCQSLSTTARDATSALRGFGASTISQSSAKCVATAENDSNLFLRGQHRFPLASTARPVAGEHPTHAAEVPDEAGVLPHSPESGVGAGFEE